MPFDLSGKVALVTGGARGIGLGIVHALHCAGASVVIGDLDTVAAHQAAASVGDGVAVQHLDVSSVESCRETVARVIESSGQLDILVNNAGICPLCPLPDVDESFFDKLVAVNLRGPYFLSQAAGAHMVSRRTGRIINISSVGGKTGGYLDIPVYCLTKAGLYSMTKSFAKYLAPYGTANTIAPGLADTALTSRWNMPEMVAKIRETIPMGRLAEPSDIAAAAVFLASEEAGFITGATIDVNGGMRMD